MCVLCCVFSPGEVGSRQNPPLHETGGDGREGSGTNDCQGKPLTDSVNQRCLAAFI